MVNVEAHAVNRFRTAVPFWGQSSLIIGSLSPKRDRGTKRVIITSSSDGKCNTFFLGQRFFFAPPPHKHKYINLEMSLESKSLCSGNAGSAIGCKDSAVWTITADHNK